MANDTLTEVTGQLPQVGADLGDFLTALAPGVIAFLFILAIVGGIIAIFSAVSNVIKNSMNKRK